MGKTKNNRGKLPGRFDELVRVMPPAAIMDEVQYDNTTEMIDQLMAAGKLTRGQEHYLETLVQLVQAYEQANHAIDTSRVSGLDALKHLLEQHDMNASDLGRLLDVHPSMGSKLLRGERSLTLAHIGVLADHFRVDKTLFL